MKKFFIVFIGIAALSVFAGERENLIKQLDREYSIAEKEVTEKAVTTVELVSAAGHASNIAEKHLLLAFDYKLRHTLDATERLKIIADFQTLVREVWTLHKMPRDGMGAPAGMDIYNTETNLMRQQTAVWLLDVKAEQRWKRIADAPWILNGTTIKLNRGKASFKAERYNNKVTLELLLFPESTFSFVILQSSAPTFRLPVATIIPKFIFAN